MHNQIGSLFLILLVITTSYFSISAAQNIDTVIIGAGIAGITSLRTLTDAGRDNVLVLEASDRYGGRIRTVNVPGYPKPVELGASFFADSNFNPMIALAQQAAMTLTPFDFGITKAWKKGRPLNANQGARIFNNYVGVWTDAEPFLQTGISVVDAIAMSGYDFDDRGVETLLMTDEQVYGDNLEFIDSAAIDKAPGDLGQDLIAPNGYNQILEYLLDNPTSVRDKLQFNSLVTKIDYNNPNNKIKITYTQNNIVKQVVANKVIITVSMGVLKAGSITFVPALPAQKQNAINTVRFGSCGKGFLFFNQQASQILSQYPVNIFYRLGKLPNPRGNDALTFFYNNQFIQNQPVIQSFYCGNFSRLMETLTDQQVVDRHMTALREFLPDMPDPSSYIVTRWTSDPLYRGVYTNYAVGNLLSDFSEFANSVQSKIYFASEYVASLDTNGDLRASLGNVYTSYIAAQVAANKIINNQA